MPKISLQPLGTAQATEVELTRKLSAGNEQYRITINGSTFDAGVQWAAQDHGALHLHDQVAPFFFTRHEDIVSIWLGGCIYRFRTPQRIARRSETTAPALPAGDLTAPMPGTILKINVQPGDTFTAHQSLIIMESMKMEMTLSSPRPGRVREITCRVGELVELGQLLAKLEDEE